MLLGMLRARASGTLAVLVALAALPLLWAVATDALSFKVRANTEECFFEALEQGDRAGFSFHVRQPRVAAAHSSHALQVSR